MKATYFVFAFLFLAILGAGAALWRFSLVDPPKLEMLNLQNTDLEFTPQKGDSWYEKLANLGENKNALPTNLMYVSISPRQSNKNEKRLKFELSIPKCDFYSIFCLNRLANQSGAGLNIVKNGSSNRIILDVASKAAADDFVLNLKKYNINSKIKEAGK